MNRPTTRTEWFFFWLWWLFALTLSVALLLYLLIEGPEACA